jgi:hypothetical protein
MPPGKAAYIFLVMQLCNIIFIVLLRRVEDNSLTKVGSRLIQLGRESFFFSQPENLNGMAADSLSALLNKQMAKEPSSPKDPKNF